MVRVRLYKDKRVRRKIRVRSKIKGTADRPRISVFRSNRYIYAQAIDDEKRHTICAYSSLKLRKDMKFKDKKEEAKEVGKKLAELLKRKKVSKAVFDRGWYAYQGRVKALAEGLREGGIKI